jgi:hypothetical protein
MPRLHASAAGADRNAASTSNSVLTDGHCCISYSTRPFLIYNTLSRPIALSSKRELILLMAYSLILMPISVQQHYDVGDMMIYICI